MIPTVSLTVMCQRGKHENGDICPMFRITRLAQALAAGIWNPYITYGTVCGQGEPTLPSWVDFQNEACLLTEITVRQRAREGTEG